MFPHLPSDHGYRFHCLVGLAKDAKVIRAVSKDRPITCEDVELHEPSTILDLRRLQDAWMTGRINEETLVASMDTIAIE